MRCNVCKYAQSYIGEGSAYFEEDSGTLCWLTSGDEQTEDRYGNIGCKYNQRTLDKRYREAMESIKSDPEFFNL